MQPRRNALRVQTRHDLDIPRHTRRLGRGRVARQAQRLTDRPLVHHAVRAQGGVLGMHADHHAQAPGRLQPQAQGAGVLVRAPVIREHGRARLFQVGQFGQFLTLLPLRQCRRRTQPRKAQAASLLDQAAHDRGVVHDRTGVRHAHHRAVPTGRRRRQPTGEVFLLRLPRLTQVRVQFDQRGGDRAALPVDDLTFLGKVPALDQAVLDGDALGLVRPDALDVSNRDHACPLALQFRPTSRWYRTLMRMACPFSTCFRMRLRGPSAASLLISRSRFMGPGCRTTAPLSASCIRDSFT